MFGFSFTTVAIAASTVLAAIIGAYLIGKSDGRQDGREAALNRSVEILRERAETDDQVRSMDDRTLCHTLGGVWVPELDECQ